MKNQRMLTIVFAMALVAVAVLLSSCERGTSMLPAVETPETVTDSIPVGVIVAQTGVHAETYGLPMLRGFELAREEINANSDIDIMFIIEDDQSSVPGATAAVQSLVDQGVTALVGSAISTQLKEAFPIAQSNGVVGFSSVSSAAGLSSIGDYIFRAALAADVLVPGGVAATQAALGYQKVAVIYDHLDVYSTSIKDEAIKAFEANTVTVLTVETVETGATDFAMQLGNIMEMAPDVIFISALIPEMKGIMTQARSVGISDTVPFICPELDGPAVQKLGAAAEGAISLLSWHATSQTPGNQVFIEQYQAAYGIDPEPWAAQSYATLYILANAIKNAASIDADGIRDALAQTKDFPTILGNFSFDANGEAIYDPVVLIVKDGALVVFE